jgi:methylamine utilization protein MauJ
MDRRRWLTAAVESGIFWPTNETVLTYEGHEFVLLPETEKLAPRVAVALDDPDRGDEAMLLMRRFLSVLSWVEAGSIRVTATMEVGGGPGRISKGPTARMINPHFRVDFLPADLTSRAKLCLALYREAQNQNSPPFQFLGYFKIINMLHAGGLEQKAWINDACAKLDNYRARERLSKLRVSQADIGAYLYESGRCAVAHAFHEPVVDPDDPEHTRRLFDDLPVIKALAEFAIEREFGVKSSRTFRIEHLYQLAGFRELFGSSLVAALKEKHEIGIDSFPPIPG